MERVQETLKTILGRLDSIDSRLRRMETGMDQTRTRVGRLEDRGIPQENQSTGAVQCQHLRQDIEWLTLKWAQHDKEIERLKAR